MPGRVFIDPVTGESREVEDQDVDFFTRQGFTEETSTQAAQRADREISQERFGDKGLAAGVLGGLQGATLNTFIPLLKAAGADPDAIRGLIRENRGAFLAGELGTAAITSLAGAGLLGKLAKGTLGLAPTGLGARGSVALGARFGAGPVTAGLLEGLAEGTAFGLGQGATEVALSNKPLTTEAVASTLLSGAARGALFGSGGGLLGGLAARGAQRLGRTKVLFDPSEEVGARVFRSIDEQADLADGILAFPRPSRLDVELGSGGVSLRGGGVRSQGAFDEALAGAQAARKEFFEALGAKSKDGFSEALKRIPDNKFEDVIRAVGGYEEFIRNARRAAEISGQSIFTKNLDDLAIGLNKSVSEAFEAKGVNRLNFTDKLAIGLESAEIAELATGAQITPGGPVVDAMIGMWMIGRIARGDKSSIIGGLGGRVLRAVGGRVAAEAAGGGAVGLAGAGLRGGANVDGRAAAGAVVDGSVQQLLKRQLTSQGRIKRAASKVLGIAGQVRRRGAVTVATGNLVENFLFDKPEGNTESEKLQSKLKELRRLAGDQNMALLKLQDRLSGANMASPELAQDAKIQALKSIAFLNSKAPHDPGVINTFGVSNWRISEGSKVEFLRYVKATLDPVSVFEDLAAGKLFPEAIEAIKELWPAHFEEFQKQIMAAPEKLLKLPYSMQVALGSLFEVPTNSFMGMIPQLQTTFNSEQAQQQANDPNNDLQPTDLQNPAPDAKPTTGQQLSNKTFND